MTLKSAIYTILMEKPITRDYDHKLIMCYWGKHDGANRETLATMLWEGRLTSPESIRRTRQELNEKHPETRGLSYNNRQQKGKEERINRRNQKA